MMRVQENRERFAKFRIVRPPAAIDGGLEDQPLRILPERMPLLDNRQAENVGKALRIVVGSGFLRHGEPATRRRTGGSS